MSRIAEFIRCVLYDSKTLLMFPTCYLRECAADNDTVTRTSDLFRILILEPSPDPFEQECKVDFFTLVSCVIYFGLFYRAPDILSYTLAIGYGIFAILYLFSLSLSFFLSPAFSSVVL